MNQGFISQLIGFLTTPFGIIGVALGMLLVFRASNSRPASWLVFSICCFAASLNKFRDQWIPEPPALLPPLQQIREYGRPLAIVFLVLLVLLSLQAQGTWRREIRPPAMKYLMYVQFVIFAKTLIYGSLEFSVISALTFGGIIYMLLRGPGRWLENDDNFRLAIRSLAIAGLIFIFANTYQYIINPFPVTFHHGRFQGTTGNSQHAAVFLAATIPCFMFMVQSFARLNYLKFLWIGVLAIAMYFLLLTGSRTGLLMGAISILLFYRNNGGAWLKVILFIAISATVLMPFLGGETVTSSLGISSSVSERFTSTNNTRAEVWGYMLNDFSNNIVFGAPLYGERMGYGENSWLAAGGNLGLVGFIPMTLMGWESLKMIWQLNQLGNRNRYYFFQSSAVMAGLGSLLIGSIFEPFLLGNITFSLMAFLTYLVMGGYLLEVDRVRTYYARVEAEQMEQSGVYQ
ncbi:O-antigen ligase family protein [Chamaesiphon polymorphus]|uniref:O-antigen polymerase n=1 Tax=Chamaesiphon polymorphus CCALA 037 TaxID=2107692 RepID=A0A2T1GMF3_9CYAN|nr:hypothetical protein [Chamaesiphon polymorphus]PSB59028.1 hypothetical protein C7B77_02420 [Chamaesiphon polymorphus CCALA 037]